MPHNPASSITYEVPPILFFLLETFHIKGKVSKVKRGKAIPATGHGGP
jgi:hypothetical protein